MTDTDVRRIEDKVDDLKVAFARLEGSLSPTLKALTEGQGDLEKIVADHETRLRASERFRFAIPSASILALVCGAIEAIYYFTHLH
jgi:hypothetical protein